MMSVSDDTWNLETLLREVAPRLIPTQAAFNHSVRLMSSREHPAGRLQTVNLHHIYLAKYDNASRSNLLSADAITADGWPVRACFRALGYRCERATGSLLIGSLVADGVSSSSRVGILGSGDSTGARIERALEARGTRVVFREHGDKAKWAADRIAARLNDSQTSLLLVAVTPPDGDRIASELRRCGFDGTVIPVGGALDMFAGVRKPPNKFLSAIGMEWLFRLGQDPRRLLRRYVAQCMPVFVSDVLPLITLGRRRARRS